jgi:mannose-1-phosphate guanylyltransferase
LLVQGPPPQFRTFVGSRSVIRHAADRARRLAPSDRIVTVIDSRDRVAFEKAAGAEYPGAVLFEPWSRGTAPELFRALTYVLAHDPDAVVVVLPANHFVFPEGRFLCAAADAVQLAERFEDRVILLGQVPDGAEMDYSWIEPGRPSPGRLPGAPGKQPLPIRRLHDRPATAETELLYHQGGLLNSKVLSARGNALWTLGERHLAAVVRPFAALRTMLGGRLASLHSGDAQALSDLFDAIPEADLHRDLLGRSQNSILVLRMAYVQWSDWARTRRVRQTLERFGRYPMQPLGIT